MGAVAIQIAKYLGLTVVASASTEDSVAFVQKMGADFVVNHRNASLEEEFQTKIPSKNSRKPDFILNAHDNSRFAELLKILQVNGKLATVWKTSADDWAAVDMDDLWFNRKTVIFTLMYARSLANGGAGYQPEVVGRVFDHMAELVDAGHIKSTVTKIWGDFFENIQAAHSVQEEGKVRGKQVLSMPH